MFFPALQQYLARLGDGSDGHAASRSIWRDGQGRVQGRFFNATLTSAFQSIQALGADGINQINGFEGFARSYSASDQGLSLWRLLDQAASDDESVALDRLCRMLHAINFFRQQPAPNADASLAVQPDLYLSVHARLLAAVESHHGVAFRRVLDALEVPHERIVLQLPPVRSNQDWPLAVVLQNYRRNGFRLALNADDAQQGCQLLDLPGQAQADVIKVDAREINDEATALRLIRGAALRDVRLIFTRVDTVGVHRTLLRLGEQSQQAILAQGYLWHLPSASLSPAQPGFFCQPTDLKPGLILSACTSC